MGATAAHVVAASSPSNQTSEDTPSSAAAHPSKEFSSLSSPDTNDASTVDNGTLPRWFQSLAIFGDSTIALGFSFALLLISVGMALYLESNTHLNTIASHQSVENTRNIHRNEVAVNEEAYRKLGPVPDWVDTSVPVLEWSDDTTFAQELKASFDRDGVVAIRGLLEADLLARLDEASAKIIREQYEKMKSKPKGALTGKPNHLKQPAGGGSGTQFFTVKDGAIFMELNSTKSNDNEVNTAAAETSLPPFLEVALQSKIPEVIGKVLLQLPSNATLRLMRDIFLAKDTDEYICGWHVDDTGFWPATAEAPGVNAWIALDDMSIEGGGGFALAIGSHAAHWRQDAYDVTGSTHTFPHEGFTSARDIVERRVGNGTCNIATAAPHLHRRMEETKRIYSMKRGDIIFHTRWLFHRTVPFDRSLVQERQENEPPLLYRRYSLRYGPGTSEIPKGYGTELSVLWDVHNGGRTADQVAAEDAPWYPQAWPASLEGSGELEHMQAIATERLEKVTRHADSRRQQMRQARKLAARQQANHHHPRPPAAKN